MGNSCQKTSTVISHKRVASSPQVRDYQPKAAMKKEELDHAVAKEETTTSYENITRIYNFKKELGHGNFGTVRLASLVSNPSQKFAIKAIEKQKMKKDLYLLKRELQILRKLDHPNIIKFYETYQDEKYFYLVMEYCSGGELLDRIAKEGRLNEKEVLHIMRKAFSAVKHLHTLGIVHRDLKPENFLISAPGSEGEIKVADFGLSRYLGDTPHGRLSTAVGTALYMAPEVIKGNYDERCDNWSLGVIMYVLLSGSPPFQGDNHNAVLDKVTKGKYSTSGPEWKKVSNQAKDLINKLLKVDPDHRYTASRALDHEWFSKSSPRTLSQQQKPNEKAIKILSEYDSKQTENAFKVEVKKFIISTLSEAEMKQYREAFSFLDPSETGFISIEELEKGLKEAGFQNPQKEVESIISRVNSQGNKNLITYTAFLTAVLNGEEIYTSERILAAFNHFGANKNTDISIENIKEVMARSGRRITESEIRKMIEGVPLQKEGRINLQEFKKIMNVTPENH